MRPSSFILLLTVLCSSWTTSDESNTHFTLEEALEKKFIKVKAEALEGFESDNIKLSLENLTARNLEVSIPAGTFFKSDFIEFQDMIVMEHQDVQLASMSRLSTNVKGFCTEADDLYPEVDSGFEYSENVNPDLDSISEFLVRYPDLLAESDIIQSAIWSVTDDRGVSAIYSEGNHAVEELRALCCRLAGQEDVWYNTAASIRLTEEGRMVFESTEVNGSIKLESDRALKVRSYLLNEQGEQKWSYPGTIELPAGKVDFWFQLTVEGWPLGKYTIYYESDTETLLAQEFVLE